MTLTVPAQLRGRMSKYTPQAVRDQRQAWALDQARAGYTVSQVADALGISVSAASHMMRAAGWRWWNHKRTRMRKPGRKAGT